MKDKQIKLMLLRAFGLILTIAVGYLFLTGTRYSKLVGYLVYMSVACTLIPLPTPPYVIGMGKIFHPAIVAFIGAFGNCFAAFVEYHFITWLFSKIELQQKVETNRFFQRFARFFKRAAFLCIIFTGFAPIPFEPFRFAAILTRYNILCYLLATFMGRFPRYYLLALCGNSFQISNKLLIIMMAVLLVIPIISSFIPKVIQKKNKKIGFEKSATHL